MKAKKMIFSNQSFRLKTLPPLILITNKNIGKISAELRQSKVSECKRNTHSIRFFTTTINLNLLASNTYIVQKQT